MIRSMQNLADRRRRRLRRVAERSRVVRTHHSPEAAKRRSAPTFPSLLRRVARQARQCQARSCQYFGRRRCAACGCTRVTPQRRGAITQHARQGAAGNRSRRCGSTGRCKSRGRAAGTRPTGRLRSNSYTVRPSFLVSWQYSPVLSGRHRRPRGNTTSWPRLCSWVRQAHHHRERPD